MAKPVKTYKFGTVNAAVWEKEVTNGKKSFMARSVTFQKNYKGKDGKWASTNSFSITDIPHLVCLMNEVFADTYRRKDEPDDIRLDDEAPF